MLFKQMQYFAAVVKYHSFTEAAEHCYISQSAISQQIQALEKDLNVSLIRREGRRFSLTPAGAYFYQHCQRIIDDVSALRRETIRRGEDDEWRLCIGYPRNYSGQELHQAIAEFSHLYPEVTLHIVTGTHEELYDMLRTGRADLILNDQRRAFSDEYANFELLQCPIYVEVPNRSAASEKSFVVKEDLHDLPCILISSPEQQEQEKKYYQHTLNFDSTIIFAETLSAGRLMVAGNCGFLPIEGIGTLTPTGASVTRVPLYRGRKPILRNYCVFWQKARSNYYIEEFAHIFRHLLTDTAETSAAGQD